MTFTVTQLRWTGDSNARGVPHTTNFFIRSKSWVHYGLFARPLPVDEDGRGYHCTDFGGAVVAGVAAVGLEQLRGRGGVGAMGKLKTIIN